MKKNKTDNTIWKIIGGVRAFILAILSAGKK